MPESVKSFNMRIALTIISFVFWFFTAGADGFVHPGGLHGLEQLEAAKGRIDEEPLSRAYAGLAGQAESFLSLEPRPLANYDVPYFYFNKDESMSAKQLLSDDAFAAYTLALAYRLGGCQRQDYAAKSIEIINAWAKVNKKVSGFDGDLAACYCGVPLVLAAELVSDNPLWAAQDRELFGQWVLNVMLKSADSLKYKNNNHGCWGLYTSLVCNHYLDNKSGFAEGVELLKRQISAMIDDKGELPAENKRTNSGMWYTYFALCPMSCSAYIATNVTGVDYFNYTDADGKGLKPALDTFFRYCKNPGSWPYKKPSGLRGAVYNLFYPSADEVKMPKPDSWPGNLYEAMQGIYNEPQWDKWLEPHRPIQGGRGWMWATAFRLSEISSAAGVGQKKIEASDPRGSEASKGL